MKSIDGFRSFLGKYRIALDRDDKKADAKTAAWILKYPWQSLGIGILVLCLVLIGFNALLNPAPPTPSPALMTAAGFFDWMLKLQMAAPLWAAFFLFLWMTKWH